VTIAFYTIIAYVEYTSGPRNAPEVTGVNLAGAMPLSTERSFADEFMEEASKYLSNLGLSNPASFGIMADGTRELSTMPDGPYFLDMLNPPQTSRNAKEAVKGATVTIYEDGRRQYRCGYCGKQHDRKSRAEDCRNVDLGIKPYRCLGKCGRFVCSTSLSPPVSKLMPSSQRSKLRL
jgi:hypothetical protein